MGVDKYREWEFKMYEKYGWFMHFVMPKEDEELDPEHHGPLGANYHTHGIYFKYGHPELQIVFPCRPDIASALLWTVVARIDEGEIFEPGKKYEKIVKDYQVTFVPAVENERQVLRMILPDVAGNLGRDASYPFGLQYSDLDASLVLDESKLASIADQEKWADFKAI